VKNIKIGYFIIGSAIICGAILIGCSVVLKDSGCCPQIQNILVIGFIAHLLFVWGPIISKLKKEKSEIK